MSANVYFISDLHLSHRGMWKKEWSSRQGWIDSYETHDAHLHALYASQVRKKRDICWFLGDVSFTVKGLQYLETWPGRKILVRGNHDRLNESLYRQVFEKIYGIMMYKEFWLSHVPLHPSELRFDRKVINVHGHLHDDLIYDQYNQVDRRYINVCVEKLEGVPIPLDELRAIAEERGL